MPCDNVIGIIPKIAIVKQAFVLLGNHNWRFQIINQPCFGTSGASRTQRLMVSYKHLFAIVFRLNQQRSLLVIHIALF